MWGEGGDMPGGGVVVGGGEPRLLYSGLHLGSGRMRHVPGDAAAAETGAKAFPTS